jgi:hypothetical protein
LEAADATAVAHFVAHLGEEVWVMLGWNLLPEEWSPQRAAQVFGAAENYWRDCPKI